MDSELLAGSASRKPWTWCNLGLSPSGKPTNSPVASASAWRWRVTLIRRPKVLLLDEPLSALDKKLREKAQFELMDLQYQAGITFIVVTHDQDEAMALATRIAVMDRGRVVQVGTPAEIYEFPQSRFVADFVGTTTNLFEGTISSCQPGLTTVSCSETGCDLLVDDAGRFTPGQRVWVALRPEKIRLSKQPAAGAGGHSNQLRGMVHQLGYLGNRCTYQVKTTSGKLELPACSPRTSAAPPNGLSTGATRCT